MKAVLMSIQPRWCELIASGKKTVEVRKTKPKLEVPFKVYIYETQGRTETPFVDEEGHHIFKGRGQVIGEFVCDKIITAKIGSYFTIPVSESQIDALDLMDYADDKPVYGWHISNLVIYDKPKELSQVLNRKQAEKCVNHCEHNGMCQYCEEIRPPQSWCYVEEVEQCRMN